MPFFRLNTYLGGSKVFCNGDPKCRKDVTNLNISVLDLIMDDNQMPGFRDERPPNVRDNVCSKRKVEAKACTATSLFCTPNVFC